MPLADVLKKPRVGALLGLLAFAGGEAAAGRGGRLCVARTVDEGAMNANPVRVFGEQAGHSRRLAEPED